ncbi:MAG: patatin-like phospholipase family protein [Myxococcota bacterium]
MRFGDWLEDKPFHLRLSSGYFGFYAHSGFLRALEDIGLWPASLGGSSAGALVAGLAASGLRGAELEDELHSFRRRDFWDPAPGLGLLRGRRLRDLIGDKLLVDAFERCETPVAVSVFDLLHRRTRVIRRGPLAPALQASAALPGLFQPVWVDGRPCLDGGIGDRTSLSTAPAPGERVLFHHLTPSPRWHRRAASVNHPPSRPGMIRFSIESLPRLGPFALERGPEVYALARSLMTRALEQPLNGRDAVVMKGIA